MRVALERAVAVEVPQVAPRPAVDATERGRVEDDALADARRLRRDGELGRGHEHGRRRWRNRRGRRRRRRLGDRIREREAGRHPHAAPALGAVAAAITGVQRSRLGVRRVGHDVPRAGRAAVGRRLAEARPAKRAKRAGDERRVERERERLEPRRERRRDRARSGGRRAVEVLAVRSTQRAGERSQRDVDPQPVGVARRDDLVVGRAVTGRIDQQMHADQRALRSQSERARVEADRHRRRGGTDLPDDLTQIGPTRRPVRYVGRITSRLRRRLRRGRKRACQCEYRDHQRAAPPREPRAQAHGLSVHAEMRRGDRFTILAPRPPHCGSQVRWTDDSA